MDSSEPPNSHPGPHSRSRSRTDSGSRDGSSVGSEPDLVGSVGASASSVGNNRPELPPQGGDGSKDKGKKISKEDDDADIADQSIPRKRYQSGSSKGKEKDEDTSSSEEEITRLEGIIDNYYKNGTQPIPELSSVRVFCNDWIEEHGSNANALLLNIKMLELQAIILEIEIIRAIQNQNEVGGIDRANPNDSEDSYEQENGDNRGDKKVTNQDSGDDHVDLKDSKDLKDLTELEFDSENDSKDSVDSSSKDSSKRETDEETNTQDSTSWSSETSDGSDTKESTDSSSDYSFESKTDDGSDTKDSTDPSSDNSSESKTDGASDTKDSTDTSSDDSSESKTDDGSDTKKSSSTGSKGSSETETDHDGTDNSDSFDSKDYFSICLEQNLNARREQSTRNVADVTSSYITTRFGMLILIMMALVITIRRSRQIYHRKG